MSIVNQILKDLEKRTSRTHPAPRTATLPFFHPVKRVHKVRQMLLLLLLTAGILLLLDAYVITRHFVRSGGRQTPAKQQQVADVHQKKPDLSVAGNSLSAGLNGMTVEVQGAVTQLRFLLSKPVLYRMTASAGGTVYRVTLDNTHAKADMSQLDYTGTAIHSLKLSEQPDGSLEVLLYLRKGVRLQQAGIFPSKSPEFLMNLVYLPPVPPQPMQAAPQAPPVLSASSRGGDFSAGSLQMAMRLATAGEIDKAGSLLKSLLDITPDYHPAREALAQLLMQHSRMIEAGVVLRTGLDRYPQWLPYVDLEARRLSAQGKIHAALQLLSQQSPSLEGHPEYYALMAALYQRQNKPEMAAKLYQQLISLQPDHGRWWLGYAIALDGMDKHAEAVSAYMRALQVDEEGLSPELKAWAETRLHAG